MTRDESLALLRTRCAALPNMLEETRLSTWAPPDFGDVHERSFVATGIGAAEAPARFVVHLLRLLGLRASFAPLSRFATDAPLGGDTLLVFSQGFSPNAHLALARHTEAKTTLLFTSIAPSREGDTRARDLAELVAQSVTVRTLPPFSEEGLLLRVLGPATSTLAAIQLAEHVARSSEKRLPFASSAAIAERARAAFEAPLLFDPELLFARVSFIIPGDREGLAHGLGWKLLEGVSVPRPPSWDVLSFAHGPFQEMRDHRETILSLFEDSLSGVVDQLASMLHPERHTLVRFPHSLPGYLAFFEHDARLNAHVLAALVARPSDLSIWPGMGEDAPLYGIARRTLSNKLTTIRS